MTSNSDEFCFKPIGMIQSCFKQKFTIPRQPGLVPQATATIVLEDEFSSEEIVRGLEENSHIWILFVFHKSQLGQNKKTVRPPRLGGEKRMGIFATRSNYRPNPIGQSVVKLESIQQKDKCIHIDISGADVLDGTPVLDIKPYVPYSDAITDAHSSFASAPPEKIFTVDFDPVALTQIESASTVCQTELIELIKNLLAYDPRPAHSTDDKILATRIYDYDLKWKIDGDKVHVVALDKII